MKNGWNIKLKGDGLMNAKDKLQQLKGKGDITGLTKEKKELMRKAMEKASGKIDWNKVRDYWKYEELGE